MNKLFLRSFVIFPVLYALAAVAHLAGHPPFDVFSVPGAAVIALAAVLLGMVDYAWVAQVCARRAAGTATDAKHSVASRNAAPHWTCTMQHHR